MFKLGHFATKACLPKPHRTRYQSGAVCKWSLASMSTRTSGSGTIQNDLEIIDKDKKKKTHVVLRRHNVSRLVILLKV